MARAPIEIRSLARSHTEIAIKVLAGIAKDGTNEAARVAAAVALLDRGWGKPPQAHTGEDGKGSIQVIIRHIVEGGSSIARCRLRLCQLTPSHLKRVTSKISTGEGGSSQLYKVTVHLAVPALFALRQVIDVV